MKILVTGGSGFIGSHIVDILIEKGHEVKNYDVEHPHYNQNCDYIKADVLDQERLSYAAKGYDCIYHLAAEADVNRFYASPIYSAQITTMSTLNVLEVAKKNEISRILLASTEWVYGTLANDKQIIDEESPVSNNPDHIYTSAKIASEMFCKNYYRLFNVNYTILRFGIPFGERARPSTVTPTFINKIMSNKEVIIHGDGSQSRQFIYVKELAEGCVACLHDNAKNQILNLNGKEKISVLDIVKKLEIILNKKAIIKFVPDRAGQFGGRFISSEKAKKLLGWEVCIPYHVALQNYVKWLRVEK